jgi:hypothetical protein
MFLEPRRRRRRRPRRDDMYVQVTRALDLAVSGGRSVEPGAEPDEPYEEERTTEAEQNGACDDHIPEHCPTLEAEQVSPHGEREHITSSAIEAMVKLPYCLTRYDSSLGCARARRGEADMIANNGGRCWRATPHEPISRTPKQQLR